MLEIQSFFTEKTQGFHPLPRRFGIKSGRFHLYGPPKSGKTSLALLFAKSFKHPIYIDCSDPRITPDSLKSQILKSFLEKKLDILILDNYQPLFTLPNIQNILLITHLAPSSITLPEGFTSKLILPLSFEEYISHTASQDSINQLLNRFIKEGNSPQTLHTPDFHKITRKQDSMRLFFQDDYLLFLLLLPFQAQKITTNQLYLHLKKSIKISKDKLYSTLERLSAMHFLTLLPMHSPDSTAPTHRPKKLYFHDFSLPYALTPAPNFQAIFENMVFLELQKLYTQPITYSDDFHFEVAGKIFFAIPFPSPSIIERILSKNPKKDITIIAINPIESAPIEVIDFISFALQEETIKEEESIKEAKSIEAGQNKDE